MLSSIISPKKPAPNQTIVSKCVMTHVQLVLAIYGAVCVAATLAYVSAHKLATVHKHYRQLRQHNGRIAQ
jgi:hypothetical protein